MAFCLQEIGRIRSCSRVREAAKTPPPEAPGVGCLSHGSPTANAPSNEPSGGPAGHGTGLVATPLLVPSSVHPWTRHDMARSPASFEGKKARLLGEFRGHVEGVSWMLILAQNPSPFCSFYSPLSPPISASFWSRSHGKFCEGETSKKCATVGAADVGGRRLSRSTRQLVPAPSTHPNSCALFLKLISDAHASEVHRENPTRDYVSCPSQNLKKHCF